MEVKSGEGTVVVADRNRYSDECCNNRGLKLHNFY